MQTDYAAMRADLANRTMKQLREIARDRLEEVDK